MHTTKYGNKYTATEWNQMMNHFASEEKEIDAKDAIVAKMVVYLKKELLSLGINADVAGALCRSFSSFSFGVAVAEGKFKFSCPEREQAVMDLWNRFQKKANELF